MGNAPHVPDLVEELPPGLDDPRQHPWLLFADQELDFILFFQVLIPELFEQHLVQSLYLVRIARSGAVEQPGQVGVRLATAIPVRHREIAVVGSDERADVRTAGAGDLRGVDLDEQRISHAVLIGGERRPLIEATLKRGDAEFVAYDGDFYAVNHSFVSRIDAELSKISLSGLRYPPYGGETEPDYNKAAARSYPDEFVLLDRVLIELPDEHGIEAATSFALSGALIHVKRKGKSSVLSHLFLQVANSCELLRRSTLAWQQLSVLIREHAASDPIIASIEAAHAAARKRESELEVAFAFLGDWSGKTITSLPLFSRISMVNEARRGIESRLQADSRSHLYQIDRETAESLELRYRPQTTSVRTRSIPSADVAYFGWINGES